MRCNKRRKHENMMVLCSEVKYFSTFVQALNLLLALLVMFTKCVAILTLLSVVSPNTFYCFLFLRGSFPHTWSAWSSSWTPFNINNSLEVIVKPFRQNMKLVAEGLYVCLLDIYLVVLLVWFPRYKKISFMKILRNNGFADRLQVILPARFPSMKLLAAVRGTYSTNRLQPVYQQEEFVGAILLCLSRTNRSS